MPQCEGRVNRPGARLCLPAGICCILPYRRLARRAIALGPALGYVLGMEQIPSTENTEVQAARPGRKRYADVPLAEKLAVVTAWLEEHKAERVVSLNLSEQGGFADALLVLTAGSMRHAQSLADGVAALCHERNYEYLRIEGYEAGQWILVDLNDIVINIFLEPVRELYRLEALWGQSPARAAAGPGGEASA
ncbi:ribosome silencing factor [Desulfovibrio sp.]|uniref:ribosome silencing factor n=2 Tax=Desulfovibrio sp. TaxID=885 RepID=UPI0025C255C6|nr:ribosome silencing factor [Desulfovibrio sp.]